MENKRKLTKEEKIYHIKRCEFHRGVKDGVCPTVSIKEANILRNMKEVRK